MRVCIIGAGPAGLAAGYRLAQRGVAVTLMEAGPHVGGMSRSIDLWGHRVDLGPHRFFSKDRRVNALWHEVVANDFRAVARQTRIFFRGRFFDYPLRAGNVFANLSTRDILRSVAGYAIEQLWPERAERDRHSFEDWVAHSFGRPLFEMFFKSYSEKLWGIDCAELDADFAAQRIRRFSLGQSILSAFGLGKAKHQTLVDRFLHPKSGSGLLYERIAASIQSMGGEILLASPVTRIEIQAGVAGGVYRTDGSFHMFDHVISTMPLTQLVGAIADAPDAIKEAAGKLRFRNTIIVYLKVEAQNLFPDQWLYIHAPNVGVGRVTNFRNWVPELYGDSTATILALEYWCYDESPVWACDDRRLVELAEAELRSIGLLREARVSAGHVERLRRCYPVYQRGYREALSPIVSYLKQIRNLWPIGRYGAFKYNNQDHSILMGLLAAENIMGGQHDLWAINTDYDSYQEDGSAQQ